MRRILIIFLAVCIIITVTGCFDKASKQHNNIDDIKSYKDIPGITEEEVNAIEKLKKERDSFICGHIPGAGTYKLQDGSCTGFSAKISKIFSELFEIPFIQEHYDEFEDLKKAIDSQTIDFTDCLTPTAERMKTYYMTTAITGCALNMYMTAESYKKILSSGVSGLRLGFFEGTITVETIFNQYQELSFVFVNLSSNKEAAEAIISGEIDAFVIDNSVDPKFDDRYNIVTAEFMPLVYTPVSISTANPALEPIISVINKYLLTGGVDKTVDLYKESEREYKRFKLVRTYTDDERRYIDRLTARNGKVQTGFVCDGYPNSFYNEADKEFQGIAIDVMKEITWLTGIEFEPGIDTSGMSVTAIHSALQSGEISMVSQMLYADERKSYFKWSEIPTLTTKFALISRADYPNLNFSQVSTDRVGTTDKSVYSLMLDKWFPEHNNLVYYDTTHQTFDALEKGEVDLILLTDSLLLQQTNLNEKPGFKVNINFGSSLNYYFGFDRNANTLRSIVNKAMPYINIEAISAGWMNRTFDYSKKMTQMQANYFMIFAGISLLILMVVSLLLVRNRRLGKNLVERINEITVSQQSLQTLLDALPIPVRIVDLETNDIVYVNNSMAELLEYGSPSEIYGLKLESILPQATKDGILSTELIDMTINSENLISFEVDYKTKNGNIIESLLTTRRIDYKGRISSIGIIKDLSAEKEHSRILLEAVEREREANQSKSVFLANMSHEIRTPMNGIIGFSELALDNTVSLNAKDDYIQKIKASGEGLLQIINDILDISKIEAGKIELENIPFNISEVFRICQTIISPKAIEKGVTLYCYAEPSIGKMLIGDPTRLRQVLLNLLSNAVKFTDIGMVKLLSEIKTNTDESVTLHFEVKDDGIGMTQEQLDKIFDPFIQADNTTTRKYGGTGLGLAITKNIIELMGGELKVESTMGAGSKFAFDLTFKTIDKPYEIENQAIAMNIVRKPIFKGEILVFEDNTTNQQVIKDHLARVGLKAVIADNGKIGVEIVSNRISRNEKPFDLIFMDIHMPVMDGMEAAKKLIELGNKTPIVPLTANVMSNDREFYRIYGMPDYLAKPFKAHELWTCLLKYLTPVELKDFKNDEEQDEDEKRLIKLQINFVKDHRNAIKNISDAIETGDIKLAHRLAHTLKGLAALFERSALREAAQEVEHSLNGETPILTAEQMEVLERELNAVLAEFSPLLEKTNTQMPEIEQIDKSDTFNMLKQLKFLLESNNTDCVDYVDKLKSVSGTEELIEKIESYEFDEACEILNVIIERFGN